MIDYVCGKPTKGIDFALAALLITGKDCRGIDVTLYVLTGLRPVTYK